MGPWLRLNPEEKNGTGFASNGASNGQWNSRAGVGSRGEPRDPPVCATGLGRAGPQDKERPLVLSLQQGAGAAEPNAPLLLAMTSIRSREGVGKGDGRGTQPEKGQPLSQSV